MTALRALALDTNVLVLAVEGMDDDPQANAARKLVFDTAPASAFVVSEVVLSEILVRPMREENGELVRFYRRLLTDLRAFRLVQVSRSVLLDAARLRSMSNLKLPDAIHLVTASRAGCAAFVTMDQGMRASGLPPVIRPDDPTIGTFLQR